MQTNNNYYRQQRVASLINQALVKYLSYGQILDVRLLDNPVTFTRVEVTKDLRVASCYFVPFNNSFNVDELLEALEISKGAIRYFISKNVVLRYTPEIRFFYDHGFENAEKITQMLQSM